MKNLGKITDFFIILFFIIIQATIAEYLKVYYISFDFILVAVIALTFKNGFFYGLIYGLFAGLIFDLITNRIAGLSPLVFAVCVFLIVKMLDSGLRLKLVSYIFIVFLMTEIHTIITNIMYYLFNFNVNFLLAGIDLLLYPVYNIALIFIVFPLMRVKLNYGESIEYK